MDNYEGESEKQEMIKIAKELLLETPWTFYIHTHSISSNYNNSYYKFRTVNNIHDFWIGFFDVVDWEDFYYNWNNNSCNAISLFRNDIRPEWEHNVNSRGSELGCRDCFDEVTLKTLWTNVVLGCIGENIRHCVGVRVINKSNRSRDLFKVEIWLDTDESYLIDQTSKDVYTNVPEHAQYFTLMYHTDKKTQSRTYASNMLKRCGKK